VKMARSTDSCCIGNPRQDGVLKASSNLKIGLSIPLKTLDGRQIPTFFGAVFVRGGDAGAVFFWSTVRSRKSIVIPFLLHAFVIAPFWPVPHQLLLGVLHLFVHVGMTCPNIYYRSQTLICNHARLRPCRHASRFTSKVCTYS
jgi:hypothetical protein